MTNCKYKLRKLSIGLVSVGTMFMAAPVMGEDASQPTASVTTESPAIQTEEDQGSQAEALTGPQPVAGKEPAPASQTSPSPLTAETAKSSQKEEKAVEKAQEEGETSVVSDQADVANTPALANSKEQARPRSIRSAEATPQTMEVDKLEVDNESSKLTVKDGEKDKQLIKHRDGNPRDIFDISRDVKVNQDGTMDVTLTVKPKEIDKGTEVIVLLDTSKEMTEDAFNTAKENIKKLVITLTGKDSKNDNKNPNYNNRNSVRLIDFYRKIGEPINLSGLDADKVEEKLNEVRKKAQEDYNGWGVNLQGAIHRARQAFNSVNERSSGKRQHIVLFSQGEATQSYDVKDKKDIKKLSVDEPVTSSNPLLPWPFYLDNTTRKANLVEEGEKLQGLLKRLGIKRYDGLLDSLAKNGNSILDLGRFVGIKNPLNFITMSDLDTKKLSEDSFDYTKKVGEGYHHRSYYVRESGQVPLDSIVKKAVKAKIEKLKKEAEENSYDIFGLSKWATSLSKVFGFDTLEEKIVNKVIDYLFYKRNYVYYNHNLSAQAEAKMAREEGINFYVFDVTDPERRSKTDKGWPTGAYGERLKEKDKEARELAKKRNEKFDKYLEEMSEGQKFFTEVANAEKFKDLLTEVIVTETFEDKVTVEKGSWNEKSSKETNKLSVQHIPASTNKGILSLFFSSSPTKESLTWTLSKDKLPDTLQSGTSLTLNYKLKVHTDKFKTALQTRAKRSLEKSESNKAITEKAISGKVTYKINDKEANGNNKLEDVTLTYSKVTVPIPDIDEEIVIPPTPEKPLVEPMLPSQPSLPEIPMPEDPRESDPQIISNDGLIEFTEDTQSSMSGQNPGSGNETVVEDTQTSQEDIVLGGQGQVIDFTEDSQPGMSGDNSHTDGTVLEEGSKLSQEDEVIIGGQGQVIDFTEDTQTGMSGAGQVENPTIIEETHKPEIIMGGQSDPIDMVEDTLPGMSGSNEATVVEEDTRPKLQFHFDNEEPVPATVPTVSQTPIAQVESKVPHAKAESALPQTGDTNKLETFFTITALTVIGAAGLLGKKRRDNQTD